MKIDFICDKVYEGRKIDDDEFSFYFSRDEVEGPNHYIYLQDEYSSILVIRISLNDDKTVSFVDTDKVRKLPNGEIEEGRPLTKKDRKELEAVLDECIPSRCSLIIESILEKGLKEKVSYQGYTIKKIHKDYISFSNSTGATKKLNIAILCNAIELSHIYLEVLDSIEFLEDNDEYFGKDNIPLLWAMLSVVDPLSYQGFPKINKQFRYRRLLAAVQAQNISACLQYTDVISMDYEDAYDSATTPLGAAIEASNKKLFQWLLDNGANPCEKKTLYAALWKAVARNNKYLVQLLQAKKTIDATSVKPAICEVPRFVTSDRKIVNLLIQHGFSPNKK